MAALFLLNFTVLKLPISRLLITYRKPTKICLAVPRKLVTAFLVPWCRVIIVADQMLNFNLSLVIQTFTWLFFTNVFQLIDLQLQSTG